MQSFRTELENPIVEKDIIELERKIRLFHEGKVDEEKFRSLRLARGVYGQRQAGVQMVRIKIPFGKLTSRQLHRIADIAEEYSSGNLHATTRQDIQIHYVSLDRTPELWAKLEQDQITLREACGNTVRNITASAIAGIDPKEPFDVSPYAHAMFKYFLRNPICQEMGRKFKIAFASSEEDTAFTFIHDVGLIPKIKTIDGEEKRGFKIVIGGGLGAIPYLAQEVYDFLPQEKIIPFTESILRIFDRFGERMRRQKARFKFLLAELGLEKLLEMIEEERKSLPNPVYSIDPDSLPATELPETKNYPQAKIANQQQYELWRATNVFEQKQKGWFGVNIKLILGDLHHDKAHLLADIAKQFAGDDIRITVNQGYLLRFVQEDALPHLFNALYALDLADPGFDSTADITACPGTDSCNLGISSSTGIAKVLEQQIREEYPDLIYNQDLKIKISGCPNSCGQHGLAAIGFHGSSVKNDGKVLPALQIVLGGGNGGDGQGYLAEKVIKIPSKRGKEALRTLVDDFDDNSQEGEYYFNYFRRQGKKYFYQLLKPLADLSSVENSDYIDWGHQDQFEVKTEVGECAGVVIDLVSTLLYEAEEKFQWATEALDQQKYADAIYHSYNVFVQAAKALLLDKDVVVNSQIQVLLDFDEHYVQTRVFEFEGGFKNYVLRMKDEKPSAVFAQQYRYQAATFLEQVKKYRDKEVIAN